MNAEMVQIECMGTSGTRTKIDCQVLFAVDTFVVVEYPMFQYSVTHLPTGWKCMATDSATKAILGAQRFAALPVDWTKVTPENAKASVAHCRDELVAIKVQFGPEPDDE